MHTNYVPRNRRSLYNLFYAQTLGFDLSKVSAKDAIAFSTAFASFFSGNDRKSERAREWQIPVLNYAWLARLYFGNIHVINEIGREMHQPPGEPPLTVDTTPYALDRLGDCSMKFLRK